MNIALHAYLHRLCQGCSFVVSACAHGIQDHTIAALRLLYTSRCIARVSSQRQELNRNGITKRNA
jgi:hypothetical protein